MFLYLLMFTSLWTMSVLIYVKNRPDPFYRWLSAGLFIGGCSSFAFSVHDPIIPWLREAGRLTPELLRTLEIASIPAFTLYWYGLGYIFLIIAIRFTGWLQARTANVLSTALLVPPVFNAAATADFGAPYEIVLADVRLLNGVYIGAAILIFVVSSYSEKDAPQRRNRFRTTFVLSAALIWAYVNDFIGISRVAFGGGEFNVDSNGLWEYNAIIILWMVVFFIVYGVKYGFLGIKLRIEQQKYDYSMRNMTQGTQILNHTIKNELQKIRYLNGRARSAMNTEPAAAGAALNAIDGVTDHVLEMIDRIRDKADDIKLEVSEERLSGLVEAVLATMKPVQEGKAVIERDYAADGWLRCDPIHIREVLGNLVLNALEAVPADRTPRLQLSTRLTPRELTIFVQDNGQGMTPETAGRIFAPFFSTKKSAHSYGLGLSYCYAAMQKHGGRIAVERTEPGKGTTMSLRFPARLFRGEPPK